MEDTGGPWVLGTAIYATTVIIEIFCDLKSDIESAGNYGKIRPCDTLDLRSVPELPDCDSRLILMLFSPLRIFLMLKVYNIFLW